MSGDSASTPPSEVDVGAFKSRAIRLTVKPAVAAPIRRFGRRRARATPQDYEKLVSSLLPMAEEILLAERRIKEELLRAANAGEHERVLWLLQTWMVGSPVEVAEAL